MSRSIDLSPSGNSKSSATDSGILIQSAENQKLSVAEIVDLLGGKNINPSKSSNTYVDEKVKIDDEAIDNCEINPSKIKSPSKSQRRKGEGSGSIHCKPIKRSGKEYKQYWYHWEIWRSGDRSPSPNSQ